MREFFVTWGFILVMVFNSQATVHYYFLRIDELLWLQLIEGLVGLTIGGLAVFIGKAVEARHEHA